MRFPAVLILLFVFSMLATSAHAQSEKQREMMKRQQKLMQVQSVMMRISGILYNKELRDELDIVEDQIKDLQKLSQDFQKDMQKFNAENSKKMNEVQELFRSGEREKAMRLSMEHQTKMFEIAEEHFKHVEKMLLPHQVNRIKQISRQEVLKHMSPFKDEFGIPLAVADELDLTPGEKKKLKDAIEKAREKYYAEVVKLKENAHAEILKSIPADKREKVKDLVGEIYDKVQTKRTSREASKSRK